MNEHRTSKTIAIPERELWSLVRSILEQGRDIQVDYANGVYSSYEHCSARVDEAARERADKLLQKYGTADEPNCTHPFARLGIDADGVMWCTECFAKPLVIPPPFGEGSVTKSAAPNADPWSMCGKCGERYPSTYAHTCSNVEETSNG